MSTAHESATQVTAEHAYVPPIEVAVSIQVTALAFQEADGRFSVVVPELPGCYSAADAIEDVAANAAEAAAGWIAVEHRRRKAEATRNVVEPLP